MIDGQLIGNANGSVVVGAEGSTITGFTIRNANLAPTFNLGACIDSSNASMTIRSNRISNCRIGIWGGAGYLTIESNLIVQNHGHSGVTLTVGGLLRNNTIVDNLRGIQLQSTAPTVVNNVVVANLVGIFSTVGSSGFTILHNNVFANTSFNTASDYVDLDDLWLHHPSVWTLVHSLSTTHIAAGDLGGDKRSDLVIDFGAAFRIWTFRNTINNTTWAPLHPSSGEGIVLLDIDGNGIDEVVIDFGPGVGLWAYVNDSTWELVHSLSPEAMVVGRFH